MIAGVLITFGAWLWFFAETRYKSVTWIQSKSEFVIIEGCRVTVEPEAALEAVVLRGCFFTSKAFLRFSSGKKVTLNSLMEGYTYFVAQLRAMHLELFVPH